MVEKTLTASADKEKTSAPQLRQWLLRATTADYALVISVWAMLTRPMVGS